jgi:hypothetical protein
VTLSVHDVQGRVMAVLADGVFEPGRHPMVWDGRTAQGPATNGIYFVRFRTPDGVMTRRLVLSR